MVTNKQNISLNKGKLVSKRLKLAKNHVYFVPLGGSGEIGMNLNLYHYNDQWLMVDLGVSFEGDLGLEVIMPDTTFIENRADKLKALVITHGHEDHIGGIPYLWHLLRCPIYATPFTAYLIRNKLREAGMLSEATIIEIDPSDSVAIGHFDVTFIPVAHSIPEANALRIKTPAGTILHTGDWKIDAEPGIGDPTDVKALTAVGDEKPLALVCDSTNIFSEGRAGSEGEVKDSLIDIITSQKKRVVVSCFASNVARLQTCIEAAEASGRQIILAGRSLWNMIDAAVYTGFFQSNKNFFKDNAFKNFDRDKVLIVCTGSQGEPRAALSRIAKGNHPNIKLEPGDTVIYSSREIPGNESAIHQDQEELLDAEINVITDYDELTHVSGHPNQDELKEMYKWVRPKILIPVHGERKHLREHADFGRAHGIPMAHAPRNGQVINLSHPEGPTVEDIVEHGRLALDGTAIVHIRGDHIQGRERLASNGAIFITLVFDKNRNLQMPIDISIIGLPDIGHEESLTEDLQLIIAEDVEAILRKRENDDDYLVERLNQSIQRFVGGLLSKKPIVRVHVVNKGL